MLFSLGYSGLTRAQFLDVLHEKEVDLLIDVRTSPVSQVEGFSIKELAPYINEAGLEYMWRGQELGGKGDHITDSALLELLNLQRERRACIMCAEARPQGCHRFDTIGVRLLGSHAFTIQHIRAKLPGGEFSQGEQRPLLAVPVTSIIYNTCQQSTLF